MEQFGSQDWRAAQVREWLLLLLRFAITRDRKDEVAALAIADELDALGQQWRPSTPSFFRRTSAEVCKAIIAPDDPRRMYILKKHIARIDDPQLRRAFQAVADIEQTSASALFKAKRQDLWRGLPIADTDSAAQASRCGEIASRAFPRLRRSRR
jgi:hypothetical protein